MAKKSKKAQRVRAARARVPQATFDRPVKTAKPVQAAAQAATAPTGKRGEPVNFKEEYRYVIKDLRRLGIIAVVMLAVLVLLTLLIR